MRETPEKTLSDLDWSALLAHLAERCQTDGGREQALALRPLRDPVAARRQLDLVAECRGLLEAEVRFPLGGVAPIGPLLARLERRGVLDAEELAQVADTLAAFEGLRRIGRSHAEAAPSLAAWLEELEPLADIRAAIEESFDERGNLRDEASEQLGSLRQRVRTLRKEATGRLQGMLVSPEMAPYLQDDYFTDRQDRYVLPIRAERRHEVPGIVLGSSASGATVFVEPAAIVELNNRIKLAALELERHEQQIFADLSALVREERATIEANLRRVAQVDLWVAAARLARDLESGPVLASPGGDLVLRGLRHPLMVLSGSRVVANDVTLSPEAALVVTGPNTGGKTVLLGSIGLAAVMLQAGLPPPCTGESEIPHYEAVLTDMGDDQSIAASLSTFSAHMTNIGQVLEQAGPKTLVLLDEVAVGTDPIQGAALACAIVQAVADRRAQLVVTTHYPQLKELPARDPRFANASLGFDLEAIRPTYRLVTGAPGNSSALSVAQRLGLPAEVLERAAGLLDPAAARLDGLIAKLERERQEVAALREALEREQQEVAALRKALEGERAALAAEREALHQGSYDAAVVALRSARDDLERMRRQLRRARSEEQVRRIQKQVDQRSAAIAANAPPPAGPPGRPATASDLVPGIELWAPGLGQRVRVLSVSGDGAAAQVQAGALKARLRREELQVPEAAAAGAGRSESAGGRTPARERPRPAARGSHASDAGPAASESPGAEPAGRQDVDAADDVHVREPQTTCDLRGLRVEEAEEALARFLDRMVLDGPRSVLVVHGYGTGALRRLVRQQLRGAPQVRRLRPGRPDEGGDGVTVAFLR